VFIKCQQQQEGRTTSVVMQGAGILEDAARCHVTTEGVQLYPLLEAETTFESQAPLLYMPAIPAVISEDELQTLKRLIEVALTSTQETAMVARPAERDFDAFLRDSVQRPVSMTWHTPVFRTLVVITVVLVSYAPFHSRVMESYKSKRDSSNPELSTPETVTVPQAAPRSELGSIQDNSPEQVQFVKYAAPTV
jgi:hypothetical protein